MRLAAQPRYTATVAPSRWCARRTKYIAAKIKARTTVMEDLQDERPFLYGAFDRVDANVASNHNDRANMAVSHPFGTDSTSAFASEVGAAAELDASGDQGNLWMMPALNSDDFSTPEHSRSSRGISPWRLELQSESMSTSAFAENQYMEGSQRPARSDQPANIPEVNHEASSSPSSNYYNFSDTAFWEIRVEGEADGMPFAGSYRELFLSQPSLHDMILRDYGMFCLQKPSDTTVPAMQQHQAEYPISQTSETHFTNNVSQVAMSVPDQATHDSGDEPHAEGTEDSQQGDPIEHAGYARVDVDNDDWQMVEQDVSGLAQRFASVLTLPYDRSPDGITPGDEQQYAAKQEAGIKEIDNLPADRVVENCTKLAKLVVSIHKIGIPKADYERSLIRGKRHLEILSGIKCSLRGALVESVLRDNKRLGASVAEGTAIETIAYHPLYMMKARVALFKSNQSRARRLKAQEKEKSHAAGDETTGEGSQRKRKLSLNDENGDGAENGISSSTTVTESPPKKQKKYEG